MKQKLDILLKAPYNYTTQHNTTQHNTTQHNTTQHNTTQIIGIILSIILYLIILSIAKFYNPHLIIFFFSCVYIVIFSFCFFLFIVFKKKINYIFSASITLNIMLITLIFSIFGPVFIDRSISYHIAFIIAEKGMISATDLEKNWSQFVFQKRFDDGVAGGMLIDNKDGTYSSTEKSKLFYKVLFFLGSLANSTQEYQALKEKYNEKN